MRLRADSILRPEHTRPRCRKACATQHVFVFPQNSKVRALGGRLVLLNGVHVLTEETPESPSPSPGEDTARRRHL